MADNRIVQGSGAVESLQENLQRNQPAILASYGLVGAIAIFGGLGFLADRLWNQTPYFTFAGLHIGAAVGFGALVRGMRKVRHEG